MDGRDSVKNGVLQGSTLLLIGEIRHPFAGQVLLGLKVLLFLDYILLCPGTFWLLEGFRRLSKLFIFMLLL